MIINTANRISEVKEYYFSTKLKEIENLKNKGKDILSLGIGSPDITPENQVINELNMQSLKKENHMYQSYIGIEELRTSIANFYYRYYQVYLNFENEVLPLLGSKEGIMHISMAFLNKGDKVLVPDPGYPTYTSVSNLLETEVLKYNLDENNNWEPDFNEIEKQDLTKVKIMWVNYPNMPTGAPAKIELYKKIIDFAKKHNILIVNDNPYSFILHNKQMSILSVEGAKDVAIELNSLSKSHSMAGWRIGMILGNKHYISAILKVKSNMDSGMFKPIQLAASKALELGHNYFINLNKEYFKRRNLIYKILDELGCTYNKKYGGVFVWAKVPEKYKNGVELSDKLLYDKNVFLTPGIVFGNQGDKYVRLSLCCSQTKIKEVLTRIKSK